MVSHFVDGKPKLRLRIQVMIRQYTDLPAPYQVENQPQVSSNGQRVSDHNFMIDGVDLNVSTNGTRWPPP
jgi:hypothetical protein